MFMIFNFCFLCVGGKACNGIYDKGKSDFDALKCIFQEENDSESRLKDNEVIEISSDTEVAEQNGGDNSIINITSTDVSEDNTDNSFWNELAWYTSDSASDTSLINKYTMGSILSTTAEVKPCLKKHNVGLSQY